MNILVLLKQTFDTEEQIEIEDGKVSEEDIKFVINPYDEYAVEEAVQLKEEHGGEVTVVTFGPERSEEALRTALAMGADKAYLIENDEDDPIISDEYTVSKILTTFIKQGDYDLIIGGYMAVDDGAAQVGPRIAEELDIPHINTITDLKLDEKKIKVQKDVEGDVEFIEANLPVLVTAQQGLNEPRYPSFPAIMKAKKKPLKVITIDDLGLDEADIEAKTETIIEFLPPKKEAGRILDGSNESQAMELVKLLVDTRKVFS